MGATTEWRVTTIEAHSTAKSRGTVCSLKQIDFTSKKKKKNAPCSNLERLTFSYYHLLFVINCEKE